MTHRLIFEPEAEGELEAASLWYDQQRPGLGRRFLSAIDLTLDRIRRFPSAGAPVPRTSEDLPVRRAPVARFPYHVVYLETSKTLYVLAVAHDRRKPGYWKGRLKS